MGCKRGSGRRLFALLIALLVCTSCIALAGCSKEARTERHWKKAEKYYSENKLKEAILEYQNVIKLDPKHANAHYKLGLSYLQARMFREAFTEFSKSVELKPEMLDARNQLGQLYFLSGDRKKALEQANLILAKDAKKFFRPPAYQ